MYLPESIVWAIGWNGASGIKFFCEDSKRAEIARLFEENFDTYWSEAEDKAEKMFGDCDQKEEGYGSPITTVSVTDYGVLVLLDPLYLSYEDGDYIVLNGLGDKAFDKALYKVRKKYPEVSYKGYIGFSWSDVLSGRVEQHEISSQSPSSGDRNEVHDFVGKAIGRAMETGAFWDVLCDHLYDAEAYDFAQIIDCFHAHEKWISKDAYDLLLETADEIDEEIRPKLEEIMKAWENGEEIRKSEDELEMPGGNRIEAYNREGEDNDFKFFLIEYTNSVLDEIIKKYNIKSKLEKITDLSYINFWSDRIPGYAGVDTIDNLTETLIRGLIAFCEGDTGFDTELENRKKEIANEFISIWGTSQETCEEMEADGFDFEYKYGTYTAVYRTCEGGW